MKRITIIILFFAATGKLSAQQLQTSAFYELQGVIHNPSLAGVGEHDFIGANYRTQWSSLDDAPKTVTVFGSFNLPKHKMGISGNVFNDKTGPTSRTGISLSVAKHILFKDNSTLSLGIENRFQQFSINTAKLAETLGNDPAIGNKNNSFKYDAGFGISYTNDRLQLGASVAQLLQTKQNNYTGSLVRNQEARLYRHYYMHGSYKMNLDETSTVTPSFLIIYLPNATTEYNFAAKYRLENVFSASVGISATGNANVGAGLNLTKNIVMDYAFNIYNNPSDISNSYTNAHEFMLRYFFRN